MGHPNREGHEFHSCRHGCILDAALAAEVGFRSPGREQTPAAEAGTHKGYLIGTTGSRALPDPFILGAGTPRNSPPAASRGMTPEHLSIPEPCAKIPAGTTLRGIDQTSTFAYADAAPNSSATSPSQSEGCTTSPRGQHTPRGNRSLPPCKTCHPSPATESKPHPADRS